VTNENPNTGRLAAHIALGRVFGLDGQAEARRADARRCCSGCGAGFYNRFGDVLRLAERSNGINSKAAGFHRVELDGVAESVFIQGDPQALPQLAYILRDLHPHREHCQVKYLALPDAALVQVLQEQIMAERVFLDGANPAASILDAITVARPLIVAPIPLEKARISIMNTWISRSGSCSLAIVASLVAAIQHIAEQ